MKYPFCGLLLFFIALAAHPGELRVGAGKSKLTPPLGTPLAGYYHARGADGVIDDLYAKALVFDDGEARAAIVVCDLLTIGQGIVQATRDLIEKESGIPARNILISATHAHTGPVTPRNSVREETDAGPDASVQEYAARLPSLIAAAVRQAEQALTPAKAFAGIGAEDQLGFNRRFWMKDGTVSWNPRVNDPNIVRPAGPIDPDVGVVYFTGRSNSPLATFVNYAMHPDTVGGNKISADYPGVLAQRLAEYKGAEMLTLFANGCCGNINHRNVHWSGVQQGHPFTQRLGTILAAAVMRTFPHLKPISNSVVRVARETVSLPLAKISEAEISEAREIVKRSLANQKTNAPTFLQTVQAYKVLDVLGRQEKPWEVEVQVIALGDDVAFVSMPGEIFTEIGLTIKKASPYPFTMIAELANGSIGYIPNKPAYLEGNYEVVSARCAEGSGEKLATTAIRLLEQLHTTAKSSK